MKVCVLSPTLDAFKGGNHLPLLGKVSGVEFTVLTGKVVPKNPDLPSNVQVENMSVKLGSYYYGLSDYRFASSVLKTHPPHNPYWRQFDCIHFNQTLHPSLLSLADSVVPLLYTIHHPVTVDAELAVHETAFPQSLQWRFRYYLLQSWQKKFAKHCPSIMTVSETVKERLVADYGVDASRITVVPNGVDTAHFCPSSKQYSCDAVAVGSLIHPRKGFRYLLEVYRQLSDAGLSIADVGRRSEEQEQALKSISGVTSYGQVDSGTLLSLVQSSQTLLSASLYEGFGLSLIEALSCGRPVFAFGCGAVPEVLSAIDSDLIVPPYDTNALSQKVQSFVALPEDEKQERGTRYRQKVQSLYPLESSAESLRALYSRLCA